jgi:hypothetical protein
MLVEFHEICRSFMMPLQGIDVSRLPVGLSALLFTGNIKGVDVDAVSPRAHEWRCKINFGGGWSCKRVKPTLPST